MNIFVGNLSPSITEEELRSTFAAFGQVTAVKIMTDRFTGEPRGFGFVEMPGKLQAQTAVTKLNFQELKGQAIRVNEAQPRDGKSKPRSRY